MSGENLHQSVGQSVSRSVGQSVSRSVGQNYLNLPEFSYTPVSAVVRTDGKDS